MSRARRKRARLLKRLFKDSLVLWPPRLRTPLDLDDYETLRVEVKIARELLEEADSAPQVAEVVSKSFGPLVHACVLQRMRDIESGAV